MKDNSFNELKASVEASIAKDQDNFTYDELVGRGLFETFLKQKNITDFRFAEDKFDKVDCYINSKKKWCVEIKVRSDSAEQYNTLFMEHKKLKAMVGLIKQQEVEEGLYVNFIKNKAYLFNIRTICKALQDKKIYVNARFCNRTTAVASDIVEKKMIELPKKLAIEYEFIEGQWAKVR